MLIRRGDVLIIGTYDFNAKWIKDGVEEVK
jgi:hypothetical protein